MSLFGGLHVGTSGLQTSQNALNTVAHNMVNVDTEGYTRQQISQVTRHYNTISTSASAVSYQQVGLGVSFAEVKQVRDYFLDKSFRKESGRAGFYDVSCDAIEEVEKIFQELDGATFSDSLNNLWVSVQELSKDPSNSVNQGVFVQRCSEFVSRAQTVYDNLCKYQDDLDYTVKQKTDKINSLGKEIRDLNERILKIESAQVEHANDLRDLRNSKIDELSRMASISVNTDIDGNYIIQLEGFDFVTVGDAKEISLYEDPITGFRYPYWKALAEYDTNGEVIPSSLESAYIFDLKQKISSDLNTDIGELKSALVARGDHRATFKDLVATPLDPSDPNYATDHSDYVYSDISDSVAMNVMAEFDGLIHDVTKGINDILKQAAEKYYITDNGYATLPTAGYMIDSVTGEPYKMFLLSQDTDGYTVSNLSINETLVQSPSLLGFIRPDGIADQVCADNLKNLFSEETHLLNPEVKTRTNLANYYNSLISQVSNTGYIMRGISDNQEVTVNNLSSAREEILGVSSDEELSNMIMFQNAYNASSRYINVVSELLEHIISTLGT
ncbi:MAG: flagellar hook-associated protein FlgK [Lachnospiraceae bacterium]|nr:flagellar hook-associated protein FlgK [Lachnospiraceae bacterium]